jgi:hypothetical protein
MKHSNSIKCAVAIGCACSGGLVSQAGALGLTFDNPAFLGELDRGGGGKQKEENYINQLVGMAPGSVYGVEGKTYLRSRNQFDSLPGADFEFKINRDGTGIVLDGSFDYLLARYGSAATVVWYVGGLAGTYDLPASYGGVRGVSHYSLFHGRAHEMASQPVGVKVTDGGSTLALMGLSLASIGLVGRRLGKARTASKK